MVSVVKYALDFRLSFAPDATAPGSDAATQADSFTLVQGPIETIINP